MNLKLLTCMVVGVFGATVALTSPPAFGRGGGGFGGGGGGHGGFGGGAAMGGGFHGGGAMGGGGFRGAAIAGGGGFSGMRGAAFVGRPGGAFAQVGGPRFGGPRFAGQRFVGRPFAPRFANRAFFPNRFHRFHRFNRFAFVGAPFFYASFGDYGCWRRTWTAWGPQWINVCDYGYGWY
jgi:hypothetical protein